MEEAQQVILAILASDEWANLDVDHKFPDPEEVDPSYGLSAAWTLWPKADHLKGQVACILFVQREVIADLLLERLKLKNVDPNEAQRLPVAKTVTKDYRLTKDWIGWLSLDSIYSEVAVAEQAQNVLTADAIFDNLKVCYGCCRQISSITCSHSP